MGFRTSPEGEVLGGRGRSPGYLRPPFRVLRASPCPHRLGSPAGPGRASVPRSFSFQPQPGASSRPHPPGPARVKAAAERERFGLTSRRLKVVSRMRMGEPGELKPELPLSWGLGRSA